MRAKPLPDFASNSIFALGPRAGFPTKVRPPVGTFTDGFRGDEPIHAEYVNYLEHHRQKQNEYSANLPFMNWREVGAVPSLTLGVRMAFCPFFGVTLICDGVNNVVKYVADLPILASGPALPTRSALPSFGNFSPRDVAYVDIGTEEPFMVIVGTNSVNTQRVLRLYADGSESFQELSSSGPTDVVVDAFNGSPWIFCADDSVHGYSGVWTEYFTMPTTASVTRYGVHAGRFCQVSNVAGGVRLDWVADVDSGSLAMGVPGETVLDLLYSPVHERWLVLTTLNLYAIESSIELVTEVTEIYSTSLRTGAAVAGCLSQAGSHVIYNGAGIFTTLWSRTELSSADPLCAGIGYAHTSGNHLVRCDGSALYVVSTDTTPTARMYRSLRSFAG
jgi:hypothetical protein